MGEAGGRPEFEVLYSQNYSVDVDAVWEASRLKLSDDLVEVEDRAISKTQKTLSWGLLLAAITMLGLGLAFLFGVVSSVEFERWGLTAAFNVEKLEPFHFSVGATLIALVWLMVVFLPGRILRSEQLTQLQREKREKFVSAAKTHLEVIVRRLWLMKALGDLLNTMRPAYRGLSKSMHERYAAKLSEASTTTVTLFDRMEEAAKRRDEESLSRFTNSDHRDRWAEEQAKIRALNRATFESTRKLAETADMSGRRVEGLIDAWQSSIGNFAVTNSELARATANVLFGYLPADSQSRVSFEAFQRYEAAHEKAFEQIKTAITTSAETNTASAAADLRAAAISDAEFAYVESQKVEGDLRMSAANAGSAISNQVAALFGEVGQLFSKVGPQEKSFSDTIAVATKFSEALKQFDRSYNSYFSRYFVGFLGVVALAWGLTFAAPYLASWAV